MKLLHIVGARPQFIKAAMVSRAWKNAGEEFLLHTGQHYDENMSRLFFADLELAEPDINLEVGSGSHAEQTASMLLGIDRILLDFHPDWVVIYGDTNSTLAGALAASKRNIRLAHVEAGLRSFNHSMPEEINRIVSDRLSNALFCPTDQAVMNLADEGLRQHVYQVGDVMADALIFFAESAASKSEIIHRLELKPETYSLVTIHRSGNVDVRENLGAILEGLGKIGCSLVFPVHPRTAKMIQQYDLQMPKNIRAIEPQGYLDMIALMKNADCILTDSGGIQKEAYILGVRCITLREETEWVETVRNGWNVLVGANSGLIAEKFLNFHPQNSRPEVYGDRHAADKIVDILKHYSLEVAFDS